MATYPIVADLSTRPVHEFSICTLVEANPELPGGKTEPRIFTLDYYGINKIGSYRRNRGKDWRFVANGRSHAGMLGPVGIRQRQGGVHSAGHRQTDYGGS